MANIFDRLTARPESVEAMDSADEETSDVGAAAIPGLSGSRDLDRDAASAGPVSYTPRQVKDVALELLKYGLLEEQRKPNLYRTALAEHEALGRVQSQDGVGFDDALRAQPTIGRHNARAIPPGRAIG